MLLLWVLVFTPNAVWQALRAMSPWINMTAALLGIEAGPWCVTGLCFPLGAANLGVVAHAL